MESHVPHPLIHQQDQQQQQEEEDARRTTMLLIRVMSKRRTWASLFVLVYGLLLYSSWNLLHSILTWYNSTVPPAHSSSAARAAYASAMLGAVFGVMSMCAAAAVAVPAMLVTWITVLVLLAFCGKRRRDLVVEAKKLTAEISGVVVRVLIKEGNFVAAVCAVVGYFLLVGKGGEDGHTPFS